MRAQAQIAELTVEDPAEAFEDLRDRCDLRMLLGHAAFMREAFGAGAEGHSVGGAHGTGHGHGNGRHRDKGKGKEAKGRMGPPVDKAWLERWRVELKIAAVRPGFGYVVLGECVLIHSWIVVGCGGGECSGSSIG